MKRRARPPARCYDGAATPSGKRNHHAQVPAVGGGPRRRPCCRACHCCARGADHRYRRLASGAAASCASARQRHPDARQRRPYQGGHRWQHPPAAPRAIGAHAFGLCRARPRRAHRRCRCEFGGGGCDDAQDQNRRSPSSPPAAAPCARQKASPPARGPMRWYSSPASSPTTPAAAETSPASSAHRQSCRARW